MSDEIKTKPEQVYCIKFTIGEDSYLYDGFDIYENLTNKKEGIKYEPKGTNQRETDPYKGY